LRLVELGFALLNAGAQHWRNMATAPRRPALGSLAPTLVRMLRCWS